MTELFLGTWTMPSAGLGPVNPLPPIAGDPSLAKTADLTAAPMGLKANAAYGRVASITPYLMQDGYTRDLHPADHPAAVLENEHLRATFLPALGGRLWSLVDRDTGLDLLYTTPVFQPANLALRNAWFAGGVEWNIGTIGHTPLTCAPLHAARITAADGTPVLRLYEFERLRRLIYQLDVHLPPGSTALYVHIRVINPNESTIPLYWWSNIAVPQRADTRVLAPADRTWSYSYDNVLRHDPIAPHTTYDATNDISYPARFADAADFFFDLDPACRGWIAAVDRSGSGVSQTSTAGLAGRKLFRWGGSSGGRRWQRWLSGHDPASDDPLDGYGEIQAGLATTQFEHLPLPGGTSRSWTEAYCALHLDPALAHGPWDVARGAAEKGVISAVPDERLAAMNAAARTLADRTPDEILYRGSGWGALDRRVRARAGEPPLDRPGTPFDDATLGVEQQPWIELLETGVFPQPDGMPGSVYLHPVAVMALRSSPGWPAPALAGVAYAAGGDWEAAVAAWSESLARCDNAYARRNLALAAARRGNDAAVVEHYRRALELAVDLARPAENGSPRATELRAVAVEAMDAMIGAGAPHEALDLYAALRDDLRRLGRLRILEARAALAVGEIDRCSAILDDVTLEVADLREGEESLDELFYSCRTALIARERGIGPDIALRAEVERTVPLPAHLDFRMKPSDA